MTIEKLDKNLIPDAYLKTKITSAGNMTELMSMTTGWQGSPTRKVDKDYYVDLRTGELLKYKHIEKRLESKKSLRATFARVRGVINANVTDSEKSIFLTLTYAENMTDTKRLCSDFSAFWKRFTRWCKSNNVAVPEYICVIEPQERGAWHAHIVLIWQVSAPFIANDVIAGLWRHGFTKTQAIKDCDNVGAYFSAYMSDIPLDDVERLPEHERSRVMALADDVIEKTFKDEQGNKKTKKFVKGGRMAFYPAGMNILRCSHGIKRPEVEYLEYHEAQKKVSSDKETFSQAYAVVDDDGKKRNTIYKSHYNRKRFENQAQK